MDYIYYIYVYYIYVYYIYVYYIIYMYVYEIYVCIVYMCIIYIYIIYIYMYNIYILHIVNYIYNVCVCARVIICIHPSLSLYLSPYLCSRSCASPSSRTLGHGIPLTLFAGNIICSVFMVSPLPPVPCGAGWGGGGVAYVVWEYKIAGTSQYFTWGQPENEPQLIGSQVSHGRLGWHTSDTSVVAITDRPQRGIDLMPCKAIVARLLAAPGAGWHTAKLVFALDLRSRHPPESEKNQPNLPENDSPVVVGFVPWENGQTHQQIQDARRCAVVESLEISHVGLVKFHSGNAGHVAEPTFGGGVVLTTAGGPFHHLLTWLARVLRNIQNI